MKGEYVSVFTVSVLSIACCAPITCRVCWSSWSTAALGVASEKVYHISCVPNMSLHSHICLNYVCFCPLPLSPVVGKVEKYINSKWQKIPAEDRLKMTKLDGQVWISLYNLLLKEDCQRKYDFNNFNKSQLLKVRFEALAAWFSLSSVNFSSFLLDISCKLKLRKCVNARSLSSNNISDLLTC